MVYVLAASPTTWYILKHLENDMRSQTILLRQEVYSIHSQCRTGRCPFLVKVLRVETLYFDFRAGSSVISHASVTSRRVGDIAPVGNIAQHRMYVECPRSEQSRKYETWTAVAVARRLHRIEAQ